MEDVRPELEVEPAPTAELKTETQAAAERYSRLSHDAGNLQFQIKEMQAELENLYVKMRNARIDYLKGKKAETRAHPKEATESTGVTQ